ncbi:hypothetical protein G7E39_002822, partial [Listeria monocytogenes]|nr:hypothetical protein [Listeria monocytogenes]
KHKSKITAKEILNINDFLERKKWPELFFQDMVDRIISLYSCVSSENRPLFMEILENFRIVELKEYEFFLLDIYLQLRFSFSEMEKLLIIPGGSYKDNTTIKSGDFVSYLFKSNMISYANKKFFSNKKITITVTKNKDISQRDLENVKCQIVFIDDFIGTGNSTLETIKSYKLLDKENVCVASFFLGDAFRENEQLKNFRYFYCENVPALKNVISNQEIEQARNLLTLLGQRKKTKKNHYLLGYNDSESLISLIRCPNNTIKCFWDDDSLFPRTR